MQDFRITKATAALMTALILACSVFQSGCSKRLEPGIDAKTDAAIVRSELKKAAKTYNPQARINYLRSAYENAGQLETNWPDAKEVPVFLKKYGDALGKIPGQVAELSMQARDLDSYKWAVSNSAKVDTQYDALLKIWQMGKQWRDYFLTEYPEKSLSIFMSKAVDDHSIRFFNQYIGAFKADNYRLEFPLEKTEFNTRFCCFFAAMIKTAMKEKDTGRIKFLLDHMPTLKSVVYIDPNTKETMRALSDYVCHELKDEALACQLVGLGYDMNRVDVAKTGFGSDFAEALMADLEHAVTHVLKLNEWHGPLSPKETRFVLILPAPALRLVHQLHIDEAIEITIKTRSRKNDQNALRLIKFREETQVLTLQDYDQLLGWALKYQNRTVYDYLKTKANRADIYAINLADLGGSPTLFKQHAPRIFRKIYKTMDRDPKPDGTTLGRIDDLLISHNPEAVLYVVRKYDFENDWEDLATDGRTLLMAVCAGGNLEAAKYLIENKGADLHAKTHYFEAKTSLFGSARTQEGELSPLFFAVQSGNTELIKYLISKGASVNSRSGLGATPLMYAVSNNDLEATKTLISLRADVNSTMNEMSPSNQIDGEGYRIISTAYRRALQNGNKDILEVLIKAGARPD
jgi:hypothetical protein